MQTSNQQRLKQLLQQWQNGSLPPHLHEELLSLLENVETEEVLAEEMQQALDENTAVFDAAKKEQMLANIENHRPARRFSIRYVAAAAVLLAAVIFTFLLTQKPVQKEVLAVKEKPQPLPAPDIAAPTSNKAILTLADGRQLVLEKMSEGNIATEGNIQVVKSSDGQLVYSGNDTEMKWNTLTVPRGSKPIQLTLSDGSQVTLNAASTLTYPTVFPADSRKVTMTGEAYFDVAHLPYLNGSGNRPFLVSANNIMVEVKGTKFNVNAYNDEGATKTTLVEGAVNIVAGSKEQQMKPGEQAIVKPDATGEIALQKNADMEEALAWINGKFRFTNADVETVMRQVARWYGVDVKFAAKPKLRFGGQIDRSSTLRQMFTILETSGLHFSLNENVVTILP
ncbi:MAG TPA: FecR domain-containing protein [Flavisolibacter sp.]|nr:FecR domain-containing protein [Flavisolibacter sp.]